MRKVFFLLISVLVKERRSWFKPMALIHCQPWIWYVIFIQSVFYKSISECLMFKAWRWVSRELQQHRSGRRKESGQKRCYLPQPAALGLLLKHEFHNQTTETIKDNSYFAEALLQYAVLELLNRNRNAKSDFSPYGNTHTLCASYLAAVNQTSQAKQIWLNYLVWLMSQFCTGPLNQPVSPWHRPQWPACSSGSALIHTDWHWFPLTLVNHTLHLVNHSFPAMSAPSRNQEEQRTEADIFWHSFGVFSTQAKVLCCFFQGASWTQMEKSLLWMFLLVILLFLLLSFCPA